MFFKKNHTQPDIENNNISTEEHPVYVLGDNDLALFLMAKLQAGGKKAILLTTKAPVFEYQKIEISLKEEYNLQKNSYTFNACSHISQTPSAVLISCNNNSLRAHLTLLSPQYCQNIPIVCFNQIDNFSLIRPLFGEFFYQAYFNGYLLNNNSNLTACGLLPEITLSAPQETDEPLPIEEILKATELKITFNEKDNYNFWKNNAAQIIGYLISAPKHHISEQINNKEEKELLKTAAKELCQLAKFEKVKISEEEILRTLLETPRSFYYKNNHQSPTEQASRLGQLYSMLRTKAQTYKYQIPQLNRLIKENYDYILKK